MIWDSRPWKARLYEHAEKLTHLLSIDNLSEKDLVLAEESIMVGCFAVRKLLESEKLSEEVEAISLKSNSFPAITRRAPEWSGVERMQMSAFDNHKFDRYFDLENSVEEDVKMRDLLNQAIHSVCFQFLFNEDGKLLALLVCSDHRIRDAKPLLNILIDDIVTLFRKVAQDDVVHTFSYREPRAWKMRSRRFASEESFLEFAKANGIEAEPLNNTLSNFFENAERCPETGTLYRRESFIDSGGSTGE